MSQTQQVIATLKGVMRSRGRTYKDLADLIDISERGVKKAFSNLTLSLDRIEQICLYLNISLSDLIYLSEKEWLGEQPTFSEDQERLLASNEPAFVLFYLLLSGRETEDILRRYVFTENEMLVLLHQLTRVNLISKSGKKEKLAVMTSRAPVWIEGGLLEEKYGEQVVETMLATKSPGYKRHLTGWLSSQDFAAMTRKMKLLELEFIRASTYRTANDEQVESMALFHCIRPWCFSVLDKYLLTKKNDE